MIIFGKTRWGVPNLGWLAWVPVSSYVSKTREYVWCGVQTVKLLYRSNASLPKLAWHATVDWRYRTCSVTHGPWVETLPSAFIEGVWDGPFERVEFDRSACVFGSGAIVRNDHITFVASVSTTDYLYWQCDALGRTNVSNSLPFLLAVIGDELDPRFAEYHTINASIASGIDRYTRTIPTKKSHVSRLMHRNL